jgi:hypothetical protein
MREPAWPTAVAFVAVALASCSIVVGLLPGLDVNDGGVGPRVAFDLTRTIYIVVALAPAALVWRRPRTSAFAIWTAVGWAAAAGYWGWLREPETPDVIYRYWAYKFLEDLSVRVTVITTVVPPIAAWLGAVPQIGTDRDARVERLARAMIRVVIAAAVAIAVLGTREGELDRFGCIVVRQSAGGFALVLFLCVLIAPGALVHAAPSRRHALAWSGWALLAAAGATLVHFNFDPYGGLGGLRAGYDPDSVSIAWPRRAVELGLQGLLALLVIGPALLAACPRPRRWPSSH